jgi:phosphate starvation-inducible PhoH-like protein
VARRAKRAERPNPREDRNTQEGGRQRRSYTRQDRIGEPAGGSGFSLPVKPKKQRVEIIPRNVQQENLMASLNDEKTDIVFAVGPAGCGKTLLATLYAIKCFKAGMVDKIVITRPNVAVDDKDIGFLPGDILKKMTPWMMPVLDVFAEFYTQDEIKYMLEENVIEMVPIAFIRGRTFKNAVVLVDEAQGTTQNSMMSILTRIGEGSKMIVTGDLAQSDRGKDNGLADFLDRFENSNHISVIRFGRADVERHPVVREVLSIYNSKD